ncbi:MAG: hypothetical protein ACI9O5_002955, partial [Algoriphagus sp.]
KKLTPAKATKPPINEARSIPRKNCPFFINFYTLMIVIL